MATPESPTEDINTVSVIKGCLEIERADWMPVHRRVIRSDRMDGSAIQDEKVAMSRINPLLEDLWRIVGPRYVELSLA